jgi:hypothetical protein
MNYILNFKASRGNLNFFQSRTTHHTQHKKARPADEHRTTTNNNNNNKKTTRSTSRRESPTRSLEFEGRALEVDEKDYFYSEKHK